jgi:hypothetical protein
MSLSTFPQTAHTSGGIIAKQHDVCTAVYTVDGKERNLVYGAGRHNACPDAEGDIVTVFYDPQHPDDAATTSPEQWSTSVHAAWVMLGVSVLLMTIGLFRNRRRH